MLGWRVLGRRRRHPHDPRRHLPRRRVLGWNPRLGHERRRRRRRRTISEINASSGTVINEIPAGDGPAGVSSDGTHVWVANTRENDDQGSVSEINASSGTLINEITVGQYSSGVSSDGTHVWVTNYGEATVSEIEASSGTVIRTIPVGTTPDGVFSDRTHVWVANYEEGTVSEIEASSGTVIHTIPVGKYPSGVSSDRTHVWVTNSGENTVSEIEASSGTVIHTIPVGSNPTGVSSDGTHVWVTNSGENTVSEIEASSGTLIRTIPDIGYGGGVSSDGTHVWVTNGGEDTVSEIPTSITEAPLSNTGSASSVTQASATLNATVNPNSEEVSECKFEYGTTESYMSSMPCSALPGSGPSPVAVSASIEGLTKQTTYHFRIVATNSTGTSYGSDQTFATGPKPTTITEAASSVTRNSATLNATVNPNGAIITECKFEYGTTEFYGYGVPCSPLPGSGAKRRAAPSSARSPSASDPWGVSSDGTHVWVTNQRLRRQHGQ